MKLREFLVRHPYVSFAAVLLAVVVVATVPACARMEENSGRIDRIAKVQQQQIAARAANRERFARSDRLLCQEIEKLKARDRAIAIENHRNLDRNLRLLKIEKTPEIVKLANDTYRKALRQTAPVKGGCRALSTDR